MSSQPVSCLTTMLRIHGCIWVDRERENPEQFRETGQGYRSIVFSRVAGLPCSIKVADNVGTEETIFYEFVILRWMTLHFDNTPAAKVNIPYCYAFYKENCSVNPSLREAIEAAGGHPGAARLEMEQIPSLPFEVREQLVSIFCVPEQRDQARENFESKHCLIRLYLGSPYPAQVESFYLPDFELHLDGMRHVHLNMEEYADCMAYAMAVLHWSALTDARGVEFVLGGSRFQRRGRRTTEFWVLDFDEVEPITLDEAGVDKAIDAALDNEPFLPCYGPYLTQQLVWAVFSHKYAKYSRQILQREQWSLADRFLCGIVNRPLETSM